jgi:hypothetical protein
MKYHGPSRSIQIILVITDIYLIGFFITPTHYWSYIGNFPALFVEKDLRCPSVHYFRESWIASSHEESEDASVGLQRCEATGLKSTTLVKPLGHGLVSTN